MSVLTEEMQGADLQKLEFSKQWMQTENEKKLWTQWKSVCHNNAEYSGFYQPVISAGAINMSE